MLQYAGIVNLGTMIFLKQSADGYYTLLRRFEYQRAG
jgi:hypothetical protein